MQQINFIQVANQISNIQVYNKMYECMNNFNTLLFLFNAQVQKSQKLLFVACDILAKKLKNHELIQTSNDLDSLPNTQQWENLQAKKQAFFNIATKLYQILIGPKRTNLPKYIINSCIDVICLCIKVTIDSNSLFQIIFVNYLQLLAPDFQLDEVFIRSNNQHILYFIQGSKEALGYHHEYVVQVLNELLDYIIHLAYYPNYYNYRRNLYFFRNNYLSYLLEYSVFCLKTVLRFNINNNFQSVYQRLRPPLQLFENIVMYPFNVHVHQTEIEDDILENVSGVESEIYFPSYFRNFLCDTGLLMDILQYYTKLNTLSTTFQPIRQDIYLLVRILGRVLSPAEYVFDCEDEKQMFREIRVNFMTQILKSNKFYDSYLIMCICKINIKFLSLESSDENFCYKCQYFRSLKTFVRQAISNCSCKIQDGDKTPYRQIFQLLFVFVNTSANTILDSQSKLCAQQALDILMKQRLVTNEDNDRMMTEFGFSNSQEIQCFGEMFQKVLDIFKLNLELNLSTIHDLNLDALSNASLTFWLHLGAILLPHHNANIEQTQLIIKFLQAAIKARSIASLHYIQTLVSQILYQIKDGISITYLWKSIQKCKSIKFDDFLSYIIKYAMQILTIQNYALIQNCLQLFKSMFTKLCQHRHQSFIRYFQIIEQVCKKIDQTMLVKPDYMKLRIGFFSVISIIWINQGQVSFVYRIFKNIQLTLKDHADLIHFVRYMTDITGLLQPIESAQVFKPLIQLILVDMETILPFFLGSPEKIKVAFNEEVFLKTFVKLLLTISNDRKFRLTVDVQTQIPLRVEATFRPYLIEILNYDFPEKTVQTWLKFIRLNPIGKLLPLQKSLKQKNSPHYKNLLHQYFLNLHRLQTLQQFYYIFSFIENDIELLSDWWQQIMVRGFKPDINVMMIVNARIWQNLKQKQQLGRLLFRIANYDERYWKLSGESTTQSKYSDWFVSNYN